MITLQSKLYESLLDDENDIISNSDDVIMIGQFLENNYKINGSYTIKNKIVDVKGDIHS